MSKIKQALPEGYSVLGKSINQIFILEPRWHDKVVLVAEYRLMPDNEVIVQYETFSRSYFITDKQARKYPLEQMQTKAGYTIDVRAIPLSELEKEVLEI